MISLLVNLCICNLQQFKVEILTVVSLLTTSIECNDISMFTSTEKYLQR